MNCNIDVGQIIGYLFLAGICLSLLILLGLALFAFYKDITSWN